MRTELPLGVYAIHRKRVSSGLRMNAGTKHRRKKNFAAKIKVAGKLYHIANFQFEEEAARAYDEALFLLTHSKLVPCYLRFNDPTEFTTPSGLQLLERVQVNFTCPLVAEFWSKHFDDALKRVAVRRYYEARNIPLTHEHLKPNPRRSCSVARERGVRRGPYAPRLKKNIVRSPMSRAWLLYATHQSKLVTDYSI